VQYRHNHFATPHAAEYTRPCPRLSCRDEKPNEIHITILRRPMQRSTLVLVLGGHVGAVLDEESCEIHIMIEQRVMQRSCPILVPACRIGAVLGEYARDMYMSLL
jgi:hypothetical protein